MHLSILQYIRCQVVKYWLLLFITKSSEKLLHAILEVTWLTESSCLVQYSHLDFPMNGEVFYLFIGLSCEQVGAFCNKRFLGQACDFL